MATANPQPHPGDGSLYLDLCRLSELFSGRYSVDETAFLLQHNDNQVNKALKFSLETDPTEIRQMLERERKSWEIVTKTRRMRNEHYKKKHCLMLEPPGESILDRARKGRVSTDVRQFACGPCDNAWWSKVPDRKQVFRCKKCRVKYDPVPRDKEWGWAEFDCPHCQRKFRGWCAMDQSSPCHQCGWRVAPTRILPPTKGTNHQRRTLNVHHCQGCEEGTCVFPGYRRAHNLKLVYYASQVHDSTGSTVNTFISQGSLDNSDVVIFTPPLPTVKEYPDDHFSDVAGASSSGSSVP